jgi:uncharacterized protein
MINLIILRDIFSIYQLDPNQEIPSSICSANFYSITKTIDEISVLTNSTLDIEAPKSNKGWKGFKVDGILDFSLTGIIHDITRPLKENRISVFVISTYNTDYFFVKEDSFEKSIDILKNSNLVRLINQ